MAYNTITRSQLRTQVVAQLGAAGSTFWRTTELNFLIQESLRFWNLATGFWRTTATLTTSANTVWYALPNAITSQMRVNFQSQAMTPVSVYDMDYGRAAWENETTTSGGDVPTRPMHYIIGALNLLAIWPADAAGNNQLLVDGLASTPILVNDSDFVDIGQDELTSLLRYIQHVASFKEGGGEFKATQPLFQQFLAQAATRSGILKTSAIYRKFMGFDKGKASKRFRQPQAEEQVGAR